jgi:hypothetical protein
MKRNNGLPPDKRHPPYNLCFRSKKIENTFFYVQLGEALFQGDQDYTSKAAKKEKDESPPSFLIYDKGSCFLG